MLYPTQSVCYSPFGTRMPAAAHIVTAKLLAAVSTSDLKAAATCLTSYIDGSTTYSSIVEREAAVDAIVVAMKGFADAGMVAACIGALSHVSLMCTECAPPMATVLKLTKPFENNLLVGKAASRLLSDHICSPRKVEWLPVVTEAAARFIALFPTDKDVCCWGAFVLTEAAGVESVVLKKEHGSLGEAAIQVAVVQGAVATQTVEVNVDGAPWNAFILQNLYPRLRIRE
jgi:hypothetical protein